MSAVSADTSRTAMTIEQANHACAELVRARARNFYYGLRLTPEPQRSAIYALYGWMRRADDQVDDAGTPDEKRRRLDLFRRTTDRMIRGDDLGEANGDPVWVAFGDAVTRYKIPAGELTHTLDGLERDVVLEASAEYHHPAFRDRDELAAYCDCVASTVGRICVRIWGMRQGTDEQLAMELAGVRGLAFQLTNILRDYAQDSDAGRVYLPASDFARFGVTPQQLRAWSEPVPCRAMIADIAAWARGCYDRSRPLDEMIEPACLPALWAMTRIYGGLLGVIERQPRRVVGSSRIRLASWRKAAIAARAACMSRS